MPSIINRLRRTQLALQGRQLGPQRRAALFGDVGQVIVGGWSLPAAPV